MYCANVGLDFSHDCMTGIDLGGRNGVVWVVPRVIDWVQVIKPGNESGRAEVALVAMLAHLT